MANIIATLNIPLHEIIDGVEEESTDTFKRLVQFYKDQRVDEKPTESEKKTGSINVNATKTRPTAPLQDSTVTHSRADISIREKLETLSPRQKAYLSDFLDLDIHDRDLVVDLGDAIFRYFRQRNIGF